MWPSTASAALVACSYLFTSPQVPEMGRRVVVAAAQFWTPRHVGAATMARWTPEMLSQISARTLPIEEWIVPSHEMSSLPSPERPVRGYRALRTPDRLNELFSLRSWERQRLMAPRIDVQKELAGITQDVSAEIAELTAPATAELEMPRPTFNPAESQSVERAIAQWTPIFQATPQWVSRVWKSAGWWMTPRFESDHDAENSAGGPGHADRGDALVLASPLRDSVGDRLLPSSINVLAKPEVRTHNAPTDEDVPRIALLPDAGRPKQATPAGGTLVGWPATLELDRQLEELMTPESARNSTSTVSVRLDSLDPPREGPRPSPSEMARRWAQRVSEKLVRLRQIERLAAQEAGELIRGLETLVVAGEQLAEQLADREVQRNWLRSVHALARRVAVWKSVYRLAEGGDRIEALPSATRL
ncbi:MAG: hypothetical protein AAGA03_19295, partial [Planctomycetota bacterium]